MPPSAAAISSGSSPVSSASSERAGSRPRRADRRSRAERDGPRPLLQSPAHLHRPVVPEGSGGSPRQSWARRRWRTGSRRRGQSPAPPSEIPGTRAGTDPPGRFPGRSSGGRCSRSVRRSPRSAGHRRRCPPAGLLQQGGCIRYAHTGAPIRRETLRRRVTTVPLPGVERTFTASIKLSIMVKPMPLRSSVPVV